MERHEGHVRTADDDRRGSGQFRLLMAAAVVVAGSSFALTTVVWRLVRQAGAVEAAVHEGLAGIDRLGVANGKEMTRLSEKLADQTVATQSLDRRLAVIEEMGRADIERIQALAAQVARQEAASEQVRQELVRSAAAVVQARQEILERLAVHADRNAAARDAMIREVSNCIAHMERALIAQAEDFQLQKRQFDAAAERDRATRRAMLHEATQAFAVQVEGLRQMLDGLRIEAGASDADLGGGPGSALGGDSGETVREPAAPPSAGDVSRPAETAEQPATAAVVKEGLVE